MVKGGNNLDFRRSRSPETETRLFLDRINRMLLFLVWHWFALILY